MNDVVTTAFLHGALTLGCIAIGCRFLKFWRLSRDRFFVWFAVAFWMFAFGWSLRVVSWTASEHAYLVFIPRLMAFLLIALAIVDKNRKLDEEERG